MPLLSHFMTVSTVTFVPSEDPDQHVQTSSLIRIFAVYFMYCLNIVMLYEVINVQRKGLLQTLGYLFCSLLKKTKQKY